MLNGLSAAAARAAKALTARYRMERIVTDGFFVFFVLFRATKKRTNESIYGRKQGQRVAEALWARKKKSQ